MKYKYEYKVLQFSPESTNLEGFFNDHGAGGWRVTLLLPDNKVLFNRTIE